MTRKPPSRQFRLLWKLPWFSAELMYVLHLYISSTQVATEEHSPELPGLGYSLIPILSCLSRAFQREVLKAGQVIHTIKVQKFFLISQLLAYSHNRLCHELKREFSPWIPIMLTPQGGILEISTLPECMCIFGMN